MRILVSARPSEFLASGPCLVNVFARVIERRLLQGRQVRQTIMYRVSDTYSGEACCRHRNNETHERPVMVNRIFLTLSTTRHQQRLQGRRRITDSSAANPDRLVELQVTQCSARVDVLWSKGGLLVWETV